MLLKEFDETMDEKKQLIEEEQDLLAQMQVNQ